MVFIYNALFCLLIGGCFGKKIQNDKYKKIYIFICFFQMFLLQGLRSFDVGKDTLSYISVYENYKDSSYYAYMFTHYEIGFQILYELLKYFNASSNALLCVISALTMFGFGLFIYNNSLDVKISTFIFACMFFPNSFNIMRQYLALSIAINSYTYFSKEKYIQSIFIIFIGALFHGTMLILFIPMIFYRVKHWKISRNIVLFSTFIFLFFGDSILSSVLSITNRTYYSTGFEVDRLIRMTTILTIVYAFLFYYFAKNQKDKTYINEINFFTCISYSIMILGLLYIKYEYISRLIEILESYFLIAYPLGIKSSKSYYMPIIRFGIYSCVFFLLIVAITNSGSGIESYRLFFCR